MLPKQWRSSESLMRILAAGGRSVEVWGLCHQKASSLLQPWHHCSIPFHRAGTTETPITLLIYVSCSPSLTHSCLALLSRWPTSIRKVWFDSRLLAPSSPLNREGSRPHKVWLWNLTTIFLLISGPDIAQTHSGGERQTQQSSFFIVLSDITHCCPPPFPS